MADESYVPMAQGYAKLATEADLARDASGYTNPNLHRRVFTGEDAEKHEGELEPRKYVLSVGGVDSYRSTERIVHDDRLIDGVTQNRDEIP